MKKDKNEDSNGRDAWGKGLELLCPHQACHSPGASKCSGTQKLSKPCAVGIFMEVSSFKHGQ